MYELIAGNLFANRGGDKWATNKCNNNIRRPKTLHKRDQTLSESRGKGQGTSHTHTRALSGTPLGQLSETEG